MTQTKEREHFIPIRKADVLELLCQNEELTPTEREEFRQLCRLLEATFHFEFHEKLEDLKNTYAPFDPDADTKPIHPLAEEDEKARLDELFEKATWLLERANFKRLSREQIEEALDASTDWGLNLDVDFSVFDRLEVYARGDAIITRGVRRWRNFFRAEEVQVPVYQRLIILLRLRDHKRLGRIVDTHNVFIKIFKDIPHMDLEMLLPGTRPRMSLFDRLKISLPTLTGLGMFVFKLVATAALSIFVFLALFIPTLGYGVRSFFGYLNTKKKYELTLTQSLYFLNLDNNAGVLFRLLDEAEEQECREAMLAYFCLWREADENGWTELELDRHIEEFLERTAGIHVDFEIGDALAKLERLGLLEESPPGYLHAVPIQKALERLDAAWDDYFKYSTVEV